MSRFGRGIRPGLSVQQGQIIGYVGTTGRSTGPHLHYEVLRGGTQINPSTLSAQMGHNLAGRSLVLFQLEKARIDTLRDVRAHEAPRPLQAASLEASGEQLAR